MSRACALKARSANGIAASATGSAHSRAAGRPAQALRPARTPPARHAARPFAAHANPKDAAVAGDTLASCVPARTPGQQDRLVEELISFLKEDLQHLFDDQGIDASKYEPDVVFEDPITYYNGIQGYLFNIAFLRRVFSPVFVLHDIRRTGPLEVTTRWTMRMGLAVARGTPLRRLWDPRLTFTGTSIMGINPETGRFNRHVDTWDAVQRQRYFSLEAFLHMLSQVGDLRQGPQDPGQYEVLLKRRHYEVRRYTQLPQGAARSAGAPQEGHSVFAVADFAGTPDPKAAESVRSQLERELSKAGLQPTGSTWLLAPGGGPSAPRSPSRWRSEVLVPIQGFELWQ